MKLTITPAEAAELDRLAIRAFQGAGAAPIRPGAQLISERGITVEAFSRHPRGILMQMGSFSYASMNSPSIARMQLGRYCSVAVQVNVMDGHHPYDQVTTSPYHYGKYFKSDDIPEEYQHRGKTEPFNTSYGPVRVGNDVWIGAHSTIKAGVTIGDGAVVAGGSNVVKDVPAYAIVAGNPARVLRLRFADEICERLVASQWWRICPTQLRDLDMSDPERFVGSVEDLRASGQAIEFSPPKAELRAGRLVWQTADAAA
ncbi:CatB-related O-acetyltransferase [Oceanicella sp. SM1341]|uniref:CatB-related O-acetyltransferase n=1 Tax=Oceanicella sp. SM1341 TaxID=1548889 RepID=UPI0013006B99|nr:CatB-related O-acetyltransferase [Oceanicella sp. SM1341]